MKIYKVEIEGRTYRFREDDARLADGADPCRVAADIFARREFGRRGYCRTMREDSHAADGSSYTSEAFIGVDDRSGSCVGRNVWIRLEFENRPHEEDCFLSGRRGFGNARGYFEGGRFRVSEREAARLCRSWNITRDNLSELYVIGEMGEHVPVWTR